MRRETLSKASGRTIDLGAGTGANLGLYPDSVTELVLAEPDPHMLRKLRPKAEEAGVERRWSSAGAEEPALRGLELRHRRLHPGALHGAGPGGRPGRGGPRPQAGRPPAVRRARPLRGSRPGALAGPARKALALLRRRLPLQPRHGGDDRGRSLQLEAVEQGGAAEVAADRPAPGPGERGRLVLTPGPQTRTQRTIMVVM